MPDPSPPDRVSTPRQLWFVGVLALLWNLVGAFDYLMSQTRNASYMAEFSPEQLEFFYGFPAWVVAAWAIAVWGGVLGSLLLLMRKALAAPVFLASLLAMTVTAFHNYGIANGMEVIGGGFELAFTAVIFIVQVLLLLYARRMRERGVLT
jgi:hypothetical protein